MAYTATIKYDRALVRRALNRYMLRRLGVSFFIPLTAALLILVMVFLADNWNWFMTVVGAVLISAIAFLVFIYFARLRTAEAFFDKGDEPVVTFRFDETGVRTESDLGSADLKWQVFDEILKFSDVWLLVYAKSGYMTLPLEQFSTDSLQFIDANVNKNP